MLWQLNRLTCRGFRSSCGSGDSPTDRGEWSSADCLETPRMSKTALLEAPKLAGPDPGREAKVNGAHRERPSCCSGSAKQAQLPTPSLTGRLRERLSSLTALESHALFTLLHRGATGEDTLLKCAAGETGVSEALIVKIAKKLGFEGFRQLREALGEHNRLARANLHEELCVAKGACARLQKVLRASVQAL